MKINISYPSTGCQKVIEIDDDKKLRAFYDKRMSQEVEGDVLGDDFKGYVFRISGGNDKEGFPMKQGILTSQRVRILFSDGHSCFRERRHGERKRKSVRGCIVSSALSVLNLVIVKKGEADIPGLTDQTKPRRLGPKRASRIRKLFNLSKEDNVRQYVVRRQIVKDGKKPTSKAPKIQRLVTPERLQHKRQLIIEKRKRYQKSQKEAKEYNILLAKLIKEKRDQKLARKRSASRRESHKATEAEKKPKAAKTEQPKQDKPAAETKADKPAEKKPVKSEKKADKPAEKKAVKSEKKAEKADKPAEKKQDKKQDKPKAEQPKQDKPADKKQDKKQDKPKAEQPKQDKPAEKKAEKPKADQPKKSKK